MQKLCIALIFCLFVSYISAQTFLVTNIYSNTDCTGAVIAYSGNLASSCTALGPTYFTMPICNATGAFSGLFSDNACTVSVSPIAAVANCSSGVLQSCGSLPSGFLTATTTYSSSDCSGTIVAQTGANPACTPTLPGKTTFRVYCPTYQSCTDSGCTTCPVTPFAPVTVPPYAPVSPCNNGVLTGTLACPVVPTTTAPTSTPGSSTPGASGSNQLAPAILLLAASLVVLA